MRKLVILVKLIKTQCFHNKLKDRFSFMGFFFQTQNCGLLVKKIKYEFLI